MDHSRPGQVVSGYKTYCAPKRPGVKGQTLTKPPLPAPDAARMTLPTLLTVGYEDAELDAFLDTLHAAGVTLLVDTRERAQSRRRGYSKTALGLALKDRGIGYRHLRALGTPPAIRKAYKLDKDFAALKAGYALHLATQGATLDELGARGPAVLRGRPGHMPPQPDRPAPARAGAGGRSGEFDAAEAERVGVRTCSDAPASRLFQSEGSPWQPQNPVQQLRLERDSKAQPQYIRNVSTVHIRRTLGHLPADYMAQIEQHVREHVGLG